MNGSWVVSCGNPLRSQGTLQLPQRYFMATFDFGLGDNDEYEWLAASGEVSLIRFPFLHAWLTSWGDGGICWSWGW